MNPTESPQPSDLGNSANADWELELEGSLQRYLTERKREALLATHARAKSPGLLIDFGCGPGRWTHFFMERGWDAICIDVDGPTLAQCQRVNPRAKCIHTTRELRT